MPPARTLRRVFLLLLLAAIVAAPAGGQIVRKGPRPQAEIRLDVRPGWTWTYRVREEVAERRGLRAAEAPEVVRGIELDLEIRATRRERGGLVTMRARVLRVGVRIGETVWNAEAGPETALGRAASDERLALSVREGEGLVSVRSSGTLARYVAALGAGEWAGAVESGWLRTRLSPVFDAEGILGAEVELGDAWERRVDVGLGPLGSAEARERWSASFVVGASMGVRGVLSGWSPGDAAEPGGASVESLEMEATTLWNTSSDILGERTSRWRASGALAGGQEYELTRSRWLEQRWSKPPSRADRAPR